MTKPNARPNHRDAADARAISPVLRRHLALVAPPTPAEERALADAIVATRRDAWAAALADPARSPAALRSVLADAGRSSALAGVAKGLPFLQWVDACASAARSRPASVARSYVPGMAAMLSAVLADRAIDPTDDAIADMTSALSAGPHAGRARTLLAVLADKVRDLADRNLRLVVMMARAAHYANAGDEAAASLTVEDFISHGVDGLARGIRGFDPALGFRLSTYMGPWIRAAMGRAIASHGRLIRLPVHLAETMRRAVRVARELAQSVGREPTPVEVAAAIGRRGPAGVATVAACLGGAVPRVYASLDAPAGRARGNEDDDGLADRIDRIASDDMDPEAALIAAEERAHAAAMMSRDCISPREREVIKLRYGLGTASDDECTLQEIGEKFCISRERVRQIHDGAILRLRRAGKNDVRMSPRSC